MRQSPSQLPDSGELSLILATESLRQVPAAKQSLHYADFSTITSLLDALDLPTNLFTDVQPDIHAVVALGKELVEQAVAAIEQRPDDSTLQPLYDSIYRYLSEEDAPEVADVIFVFGARAPYRAQKAIELYRGGLAPVICIAGGAPIYQNDHEEPEAEYYRRLCIEQGIDTSHILIDTSSITIPHNVSAGLDVLDKNGTSYMKLILVSSPYSLRRCWAVMNKFLPEGVQIIRIGAKVDPAYSIQK